MNETKRPLEVLIVEDNPGDALMIEEILKDTNITLNVTIAKDGQMALDILFKQNRFPHASTPDLIVLDLNLPKVSGFQVLSKVRSTDSLRMIPVVVMTGSLNPDDEARARLMGVIDYRIKPSGAEDFDSMTAWFKEHLAPLAETDS